MMDTVGPINKESSGQGDTVITLYMIARAGSVLTQLCSCLYGEAVVVVYPEERL
jgi:hypothetical protein